MSSKRPNTKRKPFYTLISTNEVNATTATPNSVQSRQPGQVPCCHFICVNNAKLANVKSEK